jgi:hypothetical protein
MTLDSSFPPKPSPEHAKRSWHGHDGLAGVKLGRESEEYVLEILRGIEGVLHARMADPVEDRAGIDLVATLADGSLFTVQVKSGKKRTGKYRNEGRGKSKRYVGGSRDYSHVDCLIQYARNRHTVRITQELQRAMVRS